MKEVVSPAGRKKNLKMIFKNSVKTIQSIVTFHSLKRTLVSYSLKLILFYFMEFIRIHQNSFDFLLEILLYFFLEILTYFL